jgi:hypothetical protein
LTVATPDPDAVSEAELAAVDDEGFDDVASADLDADELDRADGRRR